MIGQISYKSNHRGALYTVNSVVYALCDGQALSRTSYPKLSNFWPSGAYGSTDTSIHLPDLDNVFLRAHDFSRGVDPDINERFALSDTLPSGDVIGSYQLGDMRAHDHVSGSAERNIRVRQADNRSFVNLVTTTQPTRVPENSDIEPTISEFTIASGTTGESWMPAHVKFYPYIRVA